MKPLERIYHANNIKIYHKYRFVVGYIKSFKKNVNYLKNDIDFVVTWVDGDDAQWQKSKNAYITNEEMTDNNIARYRNWDLFKYWFRSVERYAPWVRKVHLVTCGHVPCWINKAFPKLNIVRHDQFINPQYLPTFSSIPIELSLYRIQGLSEHFVYFNDDIFLTAPVYPEDFFINGLPCHCSISMPIRNDFRNGVFPHQLLGVTGLLNSYTDIEKMLIDYPEKWFSHVYGKNRKDNYNLFYNKYFPGLYFSHMECPFRISTMKKVWNLFYKQPDETCYHKFRTSQDIMHQIFTGYELVNGTFNPIKNDYYGKMIGVEPNEIAIISDVVKNKKYKSLCINDCEKISDEMFITARTQLQSIMQNEFNKKSEYEK